VSKRNSEQVFHPDSETAQTNTLAIQKWMAIALGRKLVCTRAIPEGVRNTMPVERNDDPFIVLIQVVPCASKSTVGPAVGEPLRVAVTSPLVDGAASAAVIEALAEAFGVRRGAVEIVNGDRGRRKTVRIAGSTGGHAGAPRRQITVSQLSRAVLLRGDAPVVWRCRHQSQVGPTDDIAS
jgi:hypothetical protein